MDVVEDVGIVTDGKLAEGVAEAMEGGAGVGIGLVNLIGVEGAISLWTSKVNIPSVERNV